MPAAPRTLRAWCSDRFVPGELYSFIDREWSPGDKIRLEMPMSVRATRCIDKVEADRDRVAFSRGPLLYCAEGVDNDGAVQ